MGQAEADLELLPGGWRKHKPGPDTPLDQRVQGGGEASRLAGRKYASAHCGYRETIEDERGRIVRKSLSFEDDEDAPGELHSAGDGERRHNVWR